MRATSIIVLMGLMVGTGSATARPSCLLKGSQVEINQCSEQKYQELDKKLNSNYDVLSACLKPSAEDHKRLVQAQRAWLHFRDAECSLEVGKDVEGGTGYPDLVSDCKTKLTRSRLSELETLVKCVKTVPGSACRPHIDCILLESNE